MPVAALIFRFENASFLVDALTEALVSRGGFLEKSEATHAPRQANPNISGVALIRGAGRSTKWL